MFANSFTASASLGLRNSTGISSIFFSTDSVNNSKNFFALSELSPIITLVGSDCRIEHYLLAKILGKENIIRKIIFYTIYKSNWNGRFYYNSAIFYYIYLLI